MYGRERRNKARTVDYSANSLALEREIITPTKKPAAYISELNKMIPSNLGRMNDQCLDCKALHWAGEKIAGSAFESCCKKGSVKLSLLKGAS